MRTGRPNAALILAADHYGGFVVGIVVVITGIRVLRDASLELVDTMPEPELTSEIVKTSKCVAGVRGNRQSVRPKDGLAVSHRLAHRSRAGTDTRCVARDRRTRTGDAEARTVVGCRRPGSRRAVKGFRKPHSGGATDRTAG